MKKIVILLFIIIVLTTGCSAQTNNPSLTISAAISLTDALEEIKESYEQDRNIELIFNLGGSGTLAHQIQQGAPSDLFISANQQWMDTLEDKEFIKANSRLDITGNRLALIAQTSSSLAYQSFADISPDEVTNIAIGNPESVPAGKYAADTLEHLGLWEDIEDQLVLAKDARQVLTYVETGNADIGFVYESDALSSDAINILTTAEPGLHEPILYPIAIVERTELEEEAIDFINYMNSDEAQAILKRYGFKR